MKLLVLLFAFTLQASASLLPIKHQELDRRATTTTSAAPACTAGSDVVVNGAFYSYQDVSPSYEPWNLTPTGGSGGCQYVNGYDPCSGSETGFGSYDPDCLYERSRHHHALV